MSAPLEGQRRIVNDEGPSGTGFFARLLRAGGGEAPPTSDGQRVGSASSSAPLWLAGIALAGGGFAVGTGAVTL